MGAADRSIRRARHAALALARARSFAATVAIALLALIAASCTDAADDERGVEDSALATDGSDAASGDDVAGDESGTGTTDGSDPAAPNEEPGEAEDDPDPNQANDEPDDGDRDAVDDGDDGDLEPNQDDAEEIDPFEELEWALTPAGPPSPSVNDDSIYKVLDDLDPEQCQAELDGPSAFEPSLYETGERTAELYRAGAWLCVGDAAAAETAYRDALELEWPAAARQPIQSRVCNMWDAVTRMVDPGAGPCTLEELPVDDATEAGDDDEGQDDPSSPTEGGQSTESEDADAPADDSSEAGDPSETDDPSETGEAPVTDDPQDASSDDDGAP